MGPSCAVVCVARDCRMLRGSDVALLEGILGRLELQERRRYGFIVWDVSCAVLARTSLRVTGRVVLPAQVQRVTEVVRRWAPAGCRTEVRVTSLVGRPRAGAGAPPDTLRGELVRPVGLLDVYRTPPLVSGTAHELCTQVDPEMGGLRLVWTRGRWGLVALPDGVVGWVALAGVTRWRAPASPAPRCRPVWAPARMEWEPGQLDACRRWTGQAYLLGGNSGSGVDCSALVQRFFWQTQRVLLPRHTRDQWRCGRKVPFGERKAGDLLFIGRSGRLALHVGVFLDRERFLHASSRLGRVVVSALHDAWSGHVLGVVRPQQGCNRVGYS